MIYLIKCYHLLSSRYLNVTGADKTKTYYSVYKKAKNVTASTNKFFEKRPEYLDKYLRV